MNLGEARKSGLYWCPAGDWPSVASILQRREAAIRRTRARGGVVKVPLPVLDIERVDDEVVVFACSDADYRTLEALVRGHEVLLAARARERDRRRRVRGPREAYFPKLPTPRISRIDGAIA
ncbi:MAG: hypothetical protein BWY99_01464 [Synergistetes bacterium ADurb.BinA166]|nr:MAG: hypothetical protein BWY99_01464 [Synergistetes bacterium ADurb.BinA166]